MAAFLYVLLVLAILATVIVLMVGLGGFAGGGEFNKKYANKIMRWRIILQAVAIVFILLFVAVSQSGGN